ncbi:hypothetical protein GCM10009841_28110 [Microlunatus panaciterrae]|uniref:Uncharacterized protein n=1 Tax=Microlunatus panaciterrae TaxID=400768 RepID=A0ABS2REQ3_9ACTN|nr:hypothetical protein [Microlunatus panaciterrae]MBM7797470.1 hypothetical protein [Microlunatus panaciterrae]
MNTPPEASTRLEAGGGRVVFQRGVDGFGYHLEVQDTLDWRRVTAEHNALISGPTFGLRPENVDLEGDVLTLSGTKELADGRSYSWRGLVEPVSGTSWFHWVVIVESAGFPIGTSGAVEPQIALDLGPLPPYERGDHVWFKTLVQNPTQWNNEGRGNDFPALYYYDPYLKAKFQMFFDMSPMSWMGPETIKRFQGYRCGLRRLDHGHPAAEIGLLAEAQGGQRFPAGSQVFSWYVSVQHLSDEPTPPREQDALTALVSDCLALLPPINGYWPERATSWRELADGCAVDLMDDEHCWGRDDTGEYLRSYVDGHSDAWAVTVAARGRTYDGDGPCLEAALWALDPLDDLARSLAGDPYPELRSRLRAFITAEVRRPHCAILSGRTDQPLFMGTWQYVYLLAEVWRLFEGTEDDELQKLIQNEIDTVLVPMAHTVAYLFPLQFDKASLTAVGPGPAYPVAGTFALLMLDVAAATGERSYQHEAERALRALAHVPIDAALQEVFLVAHALDAADRLCTLTGDQEWERAREYFRAQTLRMMYWYNDNTSPRTALSRHLGMFLACANIGYPAFFENIEVAARLATAAGTEDDPSDSLRILDYARRTNQSFMPVCSPDMYGPMPVGYIPFEDVPILEGPNDAGFLGQEIYGAGFTFRAHLLWDALAGADHSEVMVVNTDSYRGGTTSAPTRLTFLAYNSTAAAVSSEINFPCLADGRTGTLEVSPPGESAVRRRVDEGHGIRLSLPGGGWARLTLTLDRDHD